MKTLIHNYSFFKTDTNPVGSLDLKPEQSLKNLLALLIDFPNYATKFAKKLNEIFERKVS